MKKLKLYLAASALAAETLEQNDKAFAVALEERSKAEGVDSLDAGWFADRANELRGKFQYLLTVPLESEHAAANEAAAKKAAKK